MESPNLFKAIFAEDREPRKAIVCDRGDIAYGELRDETVRVARLLRTIGVAEGERIALLLNDSAEFIASFLAIVGLGAIAVPINTNVDAAAQQAILNDCTARILIIESQLCSTVLTGANNSLRHLEHAVVIGPAHVPNRKLPGVTEFNFHSAPTDPLPDNFPIDAGMDTPAFILYTSGSTGEPKGAVHCQSDVFYTNETFCKQVLQLERADKLFSSSRLPFAYGLGNSFSFPLLNGCTTVLCREKPTPEVIARTFKTFEPTIFFAVPVVYKLLLERHREQPLHCSSLRLCISAGEALPAHLGEEWQQTFGVKVLDGIGSTEMLHMWMSNYSWDLKYGSSGKLLDGYEARLLDSEGKTTAAREAGHLWVRGASAARGYWQRPETTDATFVDGWVRTGDLYRQDLDGFWFHMGRSDDCFKSSGQWVSPVEVEGVLLRHDGVHAAAVVEDFDEAGLPAPCAFIVRSGVNKNEDLLETQLRSTVDSALPRYKRPRNYIFVQELPYTATGKVQRFKLRRRLRSDAQTLSDASNR